MGSAILQTAVAQDGSRIADATVRQDTLHVEVLRDVDMLVTRQVIHQWLNVIDGFVRIVHDLERYAALLACYQHTVVV